MTTEYDRRMREKEDEALYSFFVCAVLLNPGLTLPELENQAKELEIEGFNSRELFDFPS